MLLRRVLQELEASQGPVSLNGLSRKLGVEPSALAGMLAFWVRKGRLKDDYAAAIAETCVSADCELSCSGVPTCPLVTRLPRSFSLVPPDAPPAASLNE